MLRAFLSYYRPYRGMVCWIAVGSFLASLLELIFPLGVRQILQQELPRGAWMQIVWICLGLGLAYLANFLLYYAVSCQSGVLSARVENDMREKLFIHLEHLPFAFFDSSRTGQLLATLTGDTAEAGELAARVASDLLVCVISMLGIVFILLRLDPVLGTLVTLLMAIKGLHTVWINLKLRDTFQATRKEFGRLSALGEENLNGVRMVKAFTAENHSIRSFVRAARHYLQARRESFQVRAYFGASIGLFTNLVNMAILLGGTWRIRQGAMSLSDLVAFFLYVGVFIKPVMRLVLFVETYQKSMAGFRRFYALLQEKEETGQELPALPPTQGTIVFRDISFAYDRGQPVLQHINLEIAAGEKVALVGATGAGKTTLVNLLLRFYDPTAGKILIDGHDVTKFSRTSVRKQMGLVQQDVFLFSESIAQNIAYGNLTGNQQEIWEAAQSARALEFIQEMPETFATEIGERGVKLSGGQRQRLALARTFLKNAPIVVLDEATSALDNITEARVQKELDTLTKGKTTILVAHRLSTVRHVDTLVVLDKGRILEQGSPEALLRKKGAYYQLWQQEAELSQQVQKKEGIQDECLCCGN